MIKFLTGIYFALLSTLSFCKCLCPLEYVSPTQNITQMKGRWYEYKKTTDFLISNTCTTYDVTCTNDTACSVNLLPNGTNTGTTNTLLSNGTYTMWGKNEIYFSVDTEKQFVILWNCKGDGFNLVYELAVLIKNISNNDTIQIVDNLLHNITVRYEHELETINNTLCSAVEKSSLSIAAFIIPVFKILTEIHF